MVILITGVSSGFGRETARLLTSQGHRVYGTVRREVEALDGVRYLYADMQDVASAEAAVNAVLDAEGCIDVFISNAGMGIGGPLEYCRPEDIARQMDVNFMGMVRFNHSVIPAMRRRGKGMIICVSSIGGVIGLPYQGAYSASKFAMEGYCEALRMELAPCGVKVVAIRPGDFSTGFTAARRTVPQEGAAEAYPAYASGLSKIVNDETHGLTPDTLARRISKIINSKHPADSYVVATFTQRLSVLLKRLLPSRLFRRIISSYYGG